MKSKLIYNSVLLALAAVGVWGCSPSNNGVAPESGLVDIRASIDGSSATRVTMNPDGSGSFVTGDVIQFTTVESGVGRAESPKVGYTLGTTSMRWSQIAPYGESVTFRAHYPSWDNVMQEEGYDFTTATTRTRTSGEDPLFATTTVSYQGGVLLNFKHVMSKVVVRLTKVDQSGTVVVDDAGVSFEDVYTEGTQNWSDGVIVGSGSKGGTTISNKPVGGGSYYQYMIPQNLNGATFKVAYTTLTNASGTKIFSSTITDDLMLQAGKILTINSKLMGDKIVIGEVTVSEWGEASELTDGEGNEGDITEDDEIDWNSDYINIGSIVDLNELAEKVNGGNDFAGKTITITKDIEVGNWTPIGKADMRSSGNSMVITGGKPFNGTFDGNGKSVKLVDISGSTAGLGLFGYVGASGTVKNLYVEGSTTVSNAGHSGGVVGVNAGRVEGCLFKGSVTSDYDDCLGAVVGHNFGQVILCGSLSESSVRFSHDDDIAMGGIVGVNESSGKIVGCFSAAGLFKYNNVGSYYIPSYAYTKDGDYRGGIVGRNVGNSTNISSCYYSPSDCGTTSVCGKADNNTINPSGSGSYASLSDLNSKIASMNAAAWASPYASEYHWVAGGGTNYPTISK